MPLRQEEKLVDLLTALTAVPERELGGMTAIDRFDFQTCWGVAQLLKLHKTQANYGIAFEFHDDIVTIDDTHQPNSIDFFN